jgi:prepilin-type N-terminal cleavage/methylation domain-containing protein
MRLKPNNRGFSLLELMITLSIILIMTGVTFIALQPVIKQNDVTTAFDTTLEVIRNYRNQAITKSRRYMITFTPAAGAVRATMTVQWFPAGIPVAPPPVLIGTYTLPPDIQFGVQPGFPATVATVPDGFGNGGTAIDFDQGMGLGSQNYIMFMPDGSSQDTLGNWNSGVVYMVRTTDVTDVYSARAVTVFGPTGRIRGWRLNPVAGVATWGQQ